MQGDTHNFARFMDTHELFFKDKTLHFFGPLTGRFREMAVACIRNLYLRLNGPEADYSYHLTRVDVLDIFVSSIRSAPALDDDAPMAAVAKMSVADRAAWMLKRLTDAGWIEAYMDSGTMQTAYRRMGLRGTSIDYHHFRELNTVRDAQSENLVTCFSLGPYGTSIKK
jgi:hypothetical protein